MKIELTSNVNSLVPEISVNSNSRQNIFILFLKTFSDEKVLILERPLYFIIWNLSIMELLDLPGELIYIIFTFDESLIKLSQQLCSTTRNIVRSKFIQIVLSTPPKMTEIRSHFSSNVDRFAIFYETPEIFYSRVYISNSHFHSLKNSFPYPLSYFDPTDYFSFMGYRSIPIPLNVKYGLDFNYRCSLSLSEKSLKLTYENIFSQEVPSISTSIQPYVDPYFLDILTYSSILSSRCRKLGIPFFLLRRFIRHSFRSVCYTSPVDKFLYLVCSAVLLDLPLSVYNLPYRQEWDKWENLSLKKETLQKLEDDIWNTLKNRYLPRNDSEI